jgi:hypothetical protein
MPTPAGWAKIERNVALDIRLFRGEFH